MSHLFRALLPAATLVGVHGAETDAKAQAPTSEARKGKAFNTIGVQEFEKLRSARTNIVLDVRTPKEYTAGHIPGAVNIDFNAPDFDKKVAALDTNKTYLVHCAAGGRSARACDKLSKTFPRLNNLDGGMKAWEKAGNRPEH